jgi:hypothetical protein
MTITIDQKLQQMYDDRLTTPKLIIPKNLPSFIKSPVFQAFLNSVYEYCLTFNSTLRHYDSISEKMQGRVGREAFLLHR